MLRDWRVETLERDELTDDLDPAAVADELDALRARLERRNGHGADRAAFVCKESDRGVLRLHRLRAPLRDTPHRHGRTGEVAEEVECVRRLIHQDAAAFSFPRAAPVCGAVVGVRPV